MKFASIVKFAHFRSFPNRQQSSFLKYLMVENLLSPSRKILPVNWHHGRNEGRVGGSSSPFSPARLLQLNVAEPLLARAFADAI